MRVVRVFSPCFAGLGFGLHVGCIRISDSSIYPYYRYYWYLESPESPESLENGIISTCTHQDLIQLYNVALYCIVLYRSCYCRCRIGERRRLEQDEKKMRMLLDTACFGDNATGGGPSPEHMAKLSRCQRWLETKTELCDPLLLRSASVDRVCEAEDALQAAQSTCDCTQEGWAPRGYVCAFHNMLCSAVPNCACALYRRHVRNSWHWLACLQRPS